MRIVINVITNTTLLQCNFPALSDTKVYSYDTGQPLRRIECACKIRYIFLLPLVLQLPGLASAHLITLDQIGHSGQTCGASEQPFSTIVLL